jgi:signal transduction histidine kinase
LNSTIENLKTAQTQLVDAEKMASLGQLTAGIAHEINNPINFVSSNIEPLRQDFTDLKTVLLAYRNLHEQSTEAKEKLAEIKALEDELGIDYALGEIDELLNGIKEGAQRTIDIVKSLRIFSRSEEKGIKPANLNDGLQSTLTILRSQMNNIELVFEPSDLPMVYGQIGRLNQVFMNVITNAIQAINQRYQGNSGGRLIVASSHQNDEVLIRISDNGLGIPNHIIKQIFEPFFTTKDVGQGTGLGLSISYGIIDDHKGKIEVESEHGKGTSFVLCIPVNSNTRPANSNAQA